MAQPNRLALGGDIDRTKPVNFTFNGHHMQGYAGDTLASALIANGVRIVGRSFKYHRPRGIMAAGTEEANALVQLETGARTLANQQATRVELYEGLSATSINCWPSPDFDLMNQAAALLLDYSSFFPFCKTLDDVVEIGGDGKYFFF